MVFCSTSMRQSGRGGNGGGGISLISACRSLAEKYRSFIIEADDREFRILNSGPSNNLGTESFHLVIGLWSTPAHGFSFRFRETRFDSSTEMDHCVQCIRGGLFPRVPPGVPSDVPSRACVENFLGKVP